MCIRDQLVMTVAMNVFPAAVFLSGRVPLRLSVGTAGGATQPATGLARVAGADAEALAAVFLPLFKAKVSATNPPKRTAMASTMPRTCLFRLDSIARRSSTD